MYQVLIIMAIGILVGYAIRFKKKLLKTVDQLVNWSIFLLLFMLGVSVGVNEKIIAGISTLGITAIFLTIGAVLGSVIAAFLTYKFLFKHNER